MAGIRPPQVVADGQNWYLGPVGHTDVRSWNTTNSRKRRVLHFFGWTATG